MNKIQVQSGLKQATQERDKCQDKFSRVTILYERPTNIFGEPIRKSGATEVVDHPC